MALKPGSYPIEGKLIDIGSSPADYAGTEIGELLSTRAVGFQKDVETYGKQTLGTVIDDAAILGMNAFLEVIVSGNESEVLDLMFSRLNPQAGSEEARFSFGGLPADYHWGHKLKKAGKTHNLILKADDFANRVSLYVPHAIVASLGPWQWTVEGEVHEACVLTIISLNDPETGFPFHLGVEAELPATPRGG